MNKKIKISVIGVTGYTGLELLRMAAAHPFIEIAHLVSRQEQPVALATLAPHLASLIDHDVQNVPLDTVAKDSDVVFLALPHTASQDIVKQLYDKVRIIDLGADFRLSDAQTYKTYYGEDHKVPALLEQSVYGLPEMNKDTIRNAALVANPGCYALLLQLIALPFAGDIKTMSVMAVTGSSGFGKTPNDLSHHPLYNDNMQSYKINTHRHIPEIIRTAQIDETQLNIVPTLGPFTRGIFATAFIETQNTPDDRDIDAICDTTYADAPYVRHQPVINIANIAGSNFCDLHYRHGQQNQIIAQGALDNLTKGSSGNAVQCMNIMFGLDETTGLHAIAPSFP